MQKLFNVKRCIGFLTVFVFSMFVFLSCSFNSPKSALEKFFENYKSKNLEESYKYLIDDNNSTIFKNHLESILSSENLKNEFSDLNNVIIEKIFDFKYEISDEVRDGDKSKFNVKLSYFNLPLAYESALNEFLARSLDFDNVDNLYKAEYISKLLINHVKKLKLEEKNLEVEVVKDKNWKVLMTTEFSEVLTGNSIKLIDILRANVLFN